MLPITFMDANHKKLYADSATTARELCSQLAEKINLKDKFGFSLYIALFDKVSSLGSGSEHVMDAISQCEQYAKEQGAQERHAPWRLFFRKEIFAPWHDPTVDPIATNLIFYQVIRGVKYGEYRCDKEDELAMIAAQQYYIEFGTEINLDKLIESLERYLPDSCFNSNDSSKSLEYWTNLIVNAIKKSYYFREKVSQLKVKEDIVEYSKLKWPLLFSRFYEAIKIDGPNLAKNDVIIAINWTGLYFVDDLEQVLLELSFPEVTSIYTRKNGRPFMTCFILSTLRGEEYTFQSPNSEDITELVSTFLTGLKDRSKYLVAIQKYEFNSNNGNGTINSNSSITSNKKIITHIDQGELLTLRDGLTGDYVIKNTWIPVVNEDGEIGDVPSEIIYVIPTMVKPSQAILSLFSSDFSHLEDGHLGSDFNYNHGSPGDGTTSAKPHTLEEYSIDYFRLPPKSTLSRTLSFSSGKKKSIDTLWRHSREPIKQPLLKKLLNKEELSTEACLAFNAILKYMGDLPSRRTRSGNDLTDTIFEGPLKFDILRDEIYCQIMKQLTDNRNRLSEERGWELMWLATGLFAPSQILLRELSLFLRTRRHPIAVDCMQRLIKTQRYVLLGWFHLYFFFLLLLFKPHQSHFDLLTSY